MGGGEYRVRPVNGPLDATVTVPGSKSIANRALVCAAVGDGVSRVSGVPDGDDTAAMIDCLAGLGVAIAPEFGSGDASAFVVGGVSGNVTPTGEVLNARLAGTTSRFVTAVAALADVAVTIDGEPPLRNRPMVVLHDALSQLGVDVRRVASGSLPVAITGPARSPRNPLSMPGNISSQYLTALMLIAPYLDGGLEIVLTTDLVSRSYVGITQAVMATFGHRDVDVGDRSITVGPGRYTAVDYAVEADASSASYPLAAAAMCGGTVRVAGLGSSSLQGDARFGDVLAAMGCTVTGDDTSTSITGGPLVGIDIDMADMSDLVPTLAVVAACASTPTTIRGVGFIRAKESDRLGDLAGELNRAGLDITVIDDGLIVNPSIHNAVPATLATHHDHRLAMAFGLLGLRADGITVDDHDVVSKSWPTFWSMIESIS